MGLMLLLARLGSEAPFSGGKMNGIEGKDAPSEPMAFECIFSESIRSADMPIPAGALKPPTILPPVNIIF